MLCVVVEREKWFLSSEVAEGEWCKFGLFGGSFSPNSSHSTVEGNLFIVGENEAEREIQDIEMVSDEYRPRRGLQREEKGEPKGMRA